MNLIQSRSLAQTVDALNEAMFFGRRMPAGQKKQAAAWIVGRQGRPRAYANTFALFPDELRQGIRLFTGERVKCAAARHIIGEEACRVLRLLELKDKPVRQAVATATASLKLPPAGAAGPRPADGQVHWLWPYRAGTFCCGACSVALWRHLLAGGFDQQEKRLAVGLRCLHDCRRGEGQWRVFPFWYTLLALVEMDLKEAVQEMRYAARRCEAAARRGNGADPWTARRGELARRVLAKV